MKILIITHRALPHGDASSVVVGNLAHALMERGCEIKVLGLTGYPEDRKTAGLCGQSESLHGSSFCFYAVSLID